MIYGYGTMKCIAQV